MKKVRAMTVFNLLFLLFHILCSYGSQFGWFGNSTIGDISDRYPSLFTPAGFTFSIWGFIYTALLALCIRQLIYAFRFPREQESNQEVIRMGAWFMINNLLAGAWVLCWTSNRIGESVILIAAQVVTLAILHLRLDIHERIRSLGSKIFTQSPLSLYFGWISIATIANVAVYLVYSQWDGAGLDLTPVTWTKIMVITAGIITILVVFLQSNVLYGLVGVWALWGILRNRQQEEFSNLREVIWITLLVIAAVCAIQLVANFTGRRKIRSRTVTE